MRPKERKIIEDAAKLIGGRSQLALALGMKENELADWINGGADVTGNSFKKLSQVLARIANRTA
jgi:hypothetical protein